MALAPLASPLCADLAGCVAWWAIAVAVIVLGECLRPRSEAWDLLCGDAAKMLEEKALRLNVPAVHCSGHTSTRITRQPDHVTCIALVAAANSVPGHPPGSPQLCFKGS